MKYRVVSYRVDDHFLIEEAILDNYEEAYDLACNWQNFYDVPYKYLRNDEVIVCIEEIKD